MSSTLIKDYLGYGTHAARPATPPVASGVTAIYFETDTLTAFAWNGSAWQQISTSGGGGGVGSVTASAPIASSGGATPNISLTGPVFVQLPFGTALPTAGSTYLGMFYMQEGDGSTTPDRFYVCRTRADGTFVWTRFQGRTKEVKMCSADFTPSGVGLDPASLYIVPYDMDENGAISITWKVVAATFRVETAGSSGTTSVKIQKYTGTGNFSLTAYLNATSVDIAASANEPTTNPNFANFAGATTVSGDKLQAEYTSLGTSAAGFSLILHLRES